MKHILQSTTSGMNVGPHMRVNQNIIFVLCIIISSLLQVIEQQPHSDLPHLHGVGWSKDVQEDTANLINRLQQEDGYLLSQQELEPLLSLGNSTITVSTEADDILKQFPQLSRAQCVKVGRLAQTVQQHDCKPSCEEHDIPGQKCKGFYPKLPCLFSLVAKTPLLDNLGKERLESIYGIHTRLQGLLRTTRVKTLEDNTDALLSLLKQLGDQPLPLPAEAGYTWHGLTFLRSLDLQTVLLKCESFSNHPDDVILLGLYHLSLMTRRHAKFHPVRRVKEVFTVKYNPVVLLATESNGEIDLLLHTQQRWFDYMTKAGLSQSSMRKSQVEIAARGDVDNGSKLERLIQAKKREVTLGEAFFLVDPQLHLVSSNVEVKWICTSCLPLGSDDQGVLKRQDQSVVLNYMAR